MYDELVKRLRERCVFLFPHHGESRSYDADLMHEAADTIEELTGFVQEAERDRDEYRERLDKANDAIEELMRRCEQFQFMPPPAWIPVTERLPESMHEYVLCCGEKGGQFVGWVGMGMIVNGKARAFQHGGRGRCITHWMPLPEPPKEE